MRYPPSHKQATRQRILDAAARTFRERGITAAGVDEVMRTAGLTHGGFYSHFRDKEELIASACLAAFEAAIPNLDRIAAGPTRAARVRLLVDSYLSVRHRDNRGTGCFVVAVGADMVRLKGAGRSGYCRAFGQHLERVGAALRLSADSERNRQRVGLLMSSLVGALLVARAIEDPQQSAAVLRSMRERLKAEFAGPVAPPGRSVEPLNDFIRGH